VEPNRPELTELDELFLTRACELAARAVGNTAPNPPVGAIVVRDGVIVGEGYHHRAGEPHAEINALAQAAERARGARLYVSLEPCAHVGKTPPCTPAVIAAGILQVVAGASDPTGHGGARQLRDAGVECIVAEDAFSRALIEMFARSYALDRPYVAVKMAMSLDGAIAPRAGVREQLTGEAMRRRVRELRIAYDAVMVGAGTVRIDDPLLTVRPPHRRLRPYTRVVVCGRESIPASRRVLDVEQGYAKTILLAAGSHAQQLANLQGKAEVLALGTADSHEVDLEQGLRALRERGIYSVLCEGGPKLATALIARGFADKFYWAIAPRIYGHDGAVPVLAKTPKDGGMPASEFHNAQRLGEDVLIEGRFIHV
jgi:diaminohydroxyphosphoribosylaminopyrimidine deaminase/5-amino-6-(5-phosphoribosylamino)uracil reductase